MMKCQVCNTILKKKNKTKHDQTKKHKYFSNLVLYKNIVKDIACDNFEDAMTSH